MTAGELRAVWGVMSVGGIAKQFRVKRSAVQEMADLLCLDGEGPEDGDPTPEQIEDYTRQLRAGWSELDHAKRSVGGRVSTAWTPPSIR
jgi:hypothetical protein